MRLKLIEVMQTPPKDRNKSFHYKEDMLVKGFAKALEIESAIFDKFRKEDDRQIKFKSLFFHLFMKYTELKVSLLSGDLTVEALVNMSP